MASYKLIKDIADEAMRSRTIERLIALREQLAREVPQKSANETLLLATWNIRDFGEQRTLESLHYIAEIIDHFDLVVIQEISSNHLDGFNTVMKILGKNWSYIMSDGVAGTKGGYEAMAFVFNTSKVKPTGIVGEIVLPDDGLIDSLQFARTPYLASFRAGWFDFKLCTVHIYYGDDKEKNKEGVVERRVNEINTIATTLLARQKKEDVSYILLGDFNITDVNGTYFNALSNGKKSGFFIPAEIQKYPTDLGQVSHYDQIAFKLKLEQSMVLYKDGEQRAGALNFTKTVYRNPEEANDWELYRDIFDPKHEKTTDAAAIKQYRSKRTWQMSDHLPLWVELRIDFSDEHLKKLAK